MVIFTCVFVFFTILLSGLATLFLTLSLLSNEWEHLGYNEDKVMEISKVKKHNLEWLPGNLGRLEMEEPILDKTEYTNKTRNKTVITVAYLIPAHGGVHGMCADITGMLQNSFILI